MIGRKNLGVSSFLLVLLALGFFFATYNLLTMVIQNKAADEIGKLNPLTQMPEKTGGGNSDMRFHVALTATDAIYSQWQSRIMYYWYKKVKDMPRSDMGKFTRILHSGKADNLMDEIPSFVVDPLPEGLDRVRLFHSLLFQFLLISFCLWFHHHSMCSIISIFVPHFKLYILPQLYI